MAQFLYDWHIMQPKIKYTYTKTGNQWRGKFKIESNRSGTFYGVPGSLSYNYQGGMNPKFKLLESPLFVTTETGTELWSDEYEYVTQLDGFTASGLFFLSTESVKINNDSYKDYRFDNVAINKAETEIIWRFTNNVQAPENAYLVVNLMYNGIMFPNYIEGLGNGLVFNAQIESPVLQRVSENNQIAQANSFLPKDPGIKLLGSSGFPARDCPVVFEIIEGEGSLKTIWPWPDEDESPSKEITIIQADLAGSFDLLGSAYLKWRLGQSGPQKMKVSYRPAGTELASMEFTAEISSCPATVTDIDNNEYPVVQIGGQCWMSENLRTSRFNTGSVISTNITHNQWSSLTTAGVTSWENNTINDIIYGKYYNGYTLTNNLCPIGWHIPTDKEWSVLELALGMNPSEIELIFDRGALENVGGKLKGVSELWISPNVGANKESLFDAIPSGKSRFKWCFWQSRLYSVFLVFYSGF